MSGFKHARLIGLNILPLAFVACGFEGFLGLATGEDHPTPDGGPVEEPKPAMVTGTVPSGSLPDLDARDLGFWQDEVRLSPLVSIAGENFEARFQAGTRHTGMVVTAQRGTVALRALVAEARPGETTSAGDFDGIDNRETAACLLAEAKASSASRALGSYPADTLQSALDDLAVLAVSGEIKSFYDMVLALAACTQCNKGSAPRFRAPVVTATGRAIQSPLHPDFILANPIDYDRDGRMEETTEKFDAALAAALGVFGFKACYCDEGEYYSDCCVQPEYTPACGPGNVRPVMRVVFAADFNQGTCDGNGFPIDRFLWAEDKPGARMFFAGGIHPESPIQDDALERLLGSWVPNQTAMYDDGTHGDDKAGDSVWTVSFLLPLGLRLGYKYSWGWQGDNWGGTEEWPGNRRLLEVADVNRDHLVGRYDNFGDETTNKDVLNRLLPANGGKGLVGWETDANLDGVADARERMADTDSDCVPDNWRTPTGVLALTTPCH